MVLKVVVEEKMTWRWNQLYVHQEKVAWRWMVRVGVEET
jgi:hypothetical protein